MSTVLRIVVASFLSLSISFAAARAGGLLCARPDLAEAAAQAVGTGDRASAAVRTLRAAGPLGLEVFAHRHSDVLARGASHPRWRPVTSAMDRVAGQRDAWASRLYWYTDLVAAKAAARASGKPILSLRLLGRLDEELSCANSRYFRTALYANRELSGWLRDSFVLHWSSERPAPRITVDYGDGRRLERTVTGNSLHYVLAADGRVLDALPGLYGPQAFRRELEASLAIARATSALDAPARDEWLRDYHVLQAGSLADLPEAANGTPDARAAGRLAMTKSRPEAPMLRAVMPRGEPEAVQGAEPASSGRLEGYAARLDPGSLALMRSKLAGTDAGRDQAAFARVVSAFERTMTLDGYRNETELRPRIHAWLARGMELEELNRKIYAELFLTPRSDPWLGLVPADAYAAIEGEGLR